MNKDSAVFPSDTIAALSSAIGDGGISIVRLSGPESIRIADKIFHPGVIYRSKDFRAGNDPDGNEERGHFSLLESASHTLHYGKIVDPETSLVVDEVIVSVMKAPRSYTREDVVEINCHGGIQVTRDVIDLVIRMGSRPAEPGEFTKRAFLNGRIDLAQAEAVLDVIRSRTESSLKVAMGQLGGALSREISVILDKATDIASHIEASIDFSEDDPDTADNNLLIQNSQSVISSLERLLSTYREGIILKEGVLAIICGKPNVGKSSLMNLLLKRDRVIVSDIPGTTRDAVEEMINLKGIPIRLVDTAGIAESSDLLNVAGMERSKKYIASSDVVIFVMDSSSYIDDSDISIIDKLKGKKVLVVLNKCDLKNKIDKDGVRKAFGELEIVTISVEKKMNIEMLEKAIADMIWSGAAASSGDAVINNARHKELLDKSFNNMLSVKEALERDLSPELISVYLKEVIYNLGMIIGRSVSDDVLDRIFQRFCIGK